MSATLAQRHPDIPRFVPDRSRVTASGLSDKPFLCELWNAEGEHYAALWSPAVPGSPPPSLKMLTCLANTVPDCWKRAPDTSDTA